VFLSPSAGQRRANAGIGRSLQIAMPRDGPAVKDGGDPEVNARLGPQAAAS
jgi:hypothetical protein